MSIVWMGLLDAIDEKLFKSGHLSLYPYLMYFTRYGLRHSFSSFDSRFLPAIIKNHHKINFTWIYKKQENIFTYTIVSKLSILVAACINLLNCFGIDNYIRIHFLPW